MDSEPVPLMVRYLNFMDGVAEYASRIQIPLPLFGWVTVSNALFDKGVDGVLPSTYARHVSDYLQKQFPRVYLYFFVCPDKQILGTDIVVLCVEIMLMLDLVLFQQFTFLKVAKMWKWCAAEC